MQVSKEQLIANLLAARTAIDNVLLMVNGVKQQVASPQAEGCQHPKDKIAHMMGGWHECLVCGERWQDE